MLRQYDLPSGGNGGGGDDHNARFVSLGVVAEQIVKRLAERHSGHASVLGGYSEEELLRAGQMVASFPERATKLRFN